MGKKKRKTVQKFLRNDMIISLGYDMSDEASQSSGSRAETRSGSSRPITAGSRIPSQQGKARLTRSAPQSSSDEDEDDEDGPDNVLITELQDANQLDEIGAGRRRKKKVTQDIKTPEPVKEEGAEWDTDLELDEEWMENFLGKKKKKKNDSEHDSSMDSDVDSLYSDKSENEDATGRLAYQKMCDRLGVVPVSYFIRHIEDKEIVMRYHGLGAKGTRAIARVLRENITLESLNLDGNWMEGEGGLHMARMLTDNDNIKEISMADNKLGPVGSYHLSKMMLVNNGLRKLNLSGNELTDKEAYYLAEAIDQNKMLKELNLSHNSFGEAAGEMLGPAIGANDILEHLDLSWNQLRRKGAVAIAKGIKENVRLKTCNLAWNGFGQEGGSAIADAIAANDSLKELDISGNRLEGLSAFLIAKGLRKNEDLTTLKLSNNPVSTSGAVAIVTALHENESSAMILLDLTDIPVEYEFLRVVEELNKRNPDFRVSHGPVLRSGNTREDIGKPALDPYPKDPLIILKEHIIVNDFRILDILQRLDSESSHCVTPEQFATALDELGVRHTKAQIEDIARNMDKNNDGTIYYGDILQEVEAARARVTKDLAELGELETLSESRRPSLGDNVAESEQDLAKSQNLRLSISRDGAQNAPKENEGILKSKSDITEKITTAVESTMLSNSEIAVEN